MVGPTLQSECFAQEALPVGSRLRDANSVIGLVGVELLRVGSGAMELEARHVRDEEVAAGELEA
jgi:hypothetical protein